MRRFAKIFSLVAILCIAVFNAGCGKDSQSKPKDKKDVAAIPVEVSQVGTGNIAAYFRARQRWKLKAMPPSSRKSAVS